jgi:hypothetical protein
MVWCFDDPYLIDRNFCFIIAFIAAPPVDIDGIREPVSGLSLSSLSLSATLLLFLRTLRWPVYSKRRLYISHQLFFMLLLYPLSPFAYLSPEEETLASHSLAELLSGLSLAAILSAY